MTRNDTESRKRIIKVLIFYNGHFFTLSGLIFIQIGLIIHAKGSSF